MSLHPARAQSRLPALALLFLVVGAAPAAAEDAAELVGRMIEAHGGYQAWAQAPAVRFRDHFIPAGASEGRRSQVVVDQDTRRAIVAIVGSEAQMAWDGERAWSIHWDLPAPPRFLALLNYYFLNLPWLTRDPGVQLEAEGTGRIPGDATEYHKVRMTFAPGVGDTPDDYYLLFIHPETHRLAANEYIVTYRDVLPEGASQTPPHVLVYDDWSTVNGLLVPTHYTIHDLDGSLYAACEVDGWSFSQPFDASRLEMPAGAVIDTSTP